MDVLDRDTGENLGEVAYTRGLTNHPLHDTRQEVREIVEACRETGVLMSPSDTSSSGTDRSEDGDDEASCHGFSSPSPEVDHYTDIEDNPMYNVMLHHIQRTYRQSDLYYPLGRTSYLSL